MEIKVLKNEFSEESNCQILVFELYFEKNERTVRFETGVSNDLDNFSEEELLVFIQETYAEEIESLKETVESLDPEPEVVLARMESSAGEE